MAFASAQTQGYFSCESPSWSLGLLHAGGCPIIKAIMGFKVAKSKKWGHYYDSFPIIVLPSWNESILLGGQVRWARWTKNVQEYHGRIQILSSVTNNPVLMYSCGAKSPSPDVFFHQAGTFEAVPVAISRPHGHLPHTNQRPIFDTTQLAQNHAQLLNLQLKTTG